MLQPALLGGLFIGILSALPIVNIANCCCLWIVGGGMVASYLTQQNNADPITAGRGAAVGFLAGVTGALVWLVAALALDTIMLPLQQRLVGEVLRNADDMPPEAREWLRMFTESGSRGLRYAVGFMFHFSMGIVFATVGGILGAVFFRRPAPLTPQAGPAE